MNCIFTITIAISCILFSACGFQGAEEEAEVTLKRIMEERMSDGGLFPEKSYCSKYWEKNEIKQWEKLEGFISKSHGSLKSYKIIETKSKGKKRGLSSAGWVGFKIITQYSAGMDGSEIIRMYRPAKGDPFRISAHNITTDLLLQVAKRTKEHKARRAQVSR